MTMKSTKINQLRITEKNNLHSKLVEISGYLKTAQSTLKRYKNTENTSKIAELESKIEKYNIDIDEMEKKIEMISAGKLDSILLDECEKNAKIIREKNNDKKLRKEAIEKQNTERKKQSIDFYNKNKTYKGKQKFCDDYYFRLCSSIPSYLTDKLNKMPNNKGYLFRGLHLYGKLPEDNSYKTTLFETKNKIQYIHEWNKDTNMYSLYEKKHRAKNVLIKRESLDKA